jgi:hypothetical protein
MSTALADAQVHSTPLNDVEEQIRRQDEQFHNGLVTAAQHAWHVGRLLSDARSLFATRGKWTEWAETKFGYSQRHVYRLVQLAQEDYDSLGEASIRSLLGEGGRPHVANNSGDDEWYTPEAYIVAARAVMGGIDLDPASTEAANAVVQAVRFFSVKDDGLSQEWGGRVWMNPPYGSDLIGLFTEKLATHYVAGDVSQACVLVNNATETQWFQALLSQASSLCLHAGRISYWCPDKDSATGLQGQVILYLGNNGERFAEVFSAFGVVCHVIR